MVTYVAAAAINNASAYNATGIECMDLFVKCNYAHSHAVCWWERHAPVAFVNTYTFLSMKYCDGIPWAPKELYASVR